jgi:AraC family transcriptional activator of pobA
MNMKVQILFLKCLPLFFAWDDLWRGRGRYRRRRPISAEFAGIMVRYMPQISLDGDGQPYQKFGLFDNRGVAITGEPMSATAMHHPPGIPIFFLYGEPRREVGPRFLHLEALADRTVPSDWNIRAHAHGNLNHVFFIASGSGRITADGTVIAFAAPCLLLVPAGVVHGFAYAPDTTGSVLTIADAYLQELTGREPAFGQIFSQTCSLELGAPAGIAARLSALGTELVWNAPGHEAAIEACLLGLFVELLRLSRYAAAPVRHVAGRAADLVARFRAEIEAHYREGATLQDYARALRVSQAQLRRACLQLAGQPPVQLIQQRLFLEAQRALLYTNMTVSEVARHLGFTDSAYFSRFFTRHAGRSPRQFRGSTASMAP